MIYLLDTSAVLAHYFAEPGGREVIEILKGGPATVALGAPTWGELERKLAEKIPDSAEADRVFQLYTRALCSFVPVDEDAVLAAIRIRRACPERLPLVNALIAGCAASRGLTLVHRDQHMDGIPAGQVTLFRLPDKSSRVGEADGSTI